MRTDNLLTEQMVEDFKAKYKKIYKTKIEDTDIILRGLNRREYSAILDIQSDNNVDTIQAREDMIIETALLYPTIEEIMELVEESAFLAERLAVEIMKISGLSEVILEKI